MLDTESIDFKAYKKLTYTTYIFRGSPPLEWLVLLQANAPRKTFILFEMFLADYGSKRTKKKFSHHSFLEREVHESRLFFLPNFLEKSGK
jgi:hypothetical protein